MKAFEIVGELFFTHEKDDINLRLGIFEYDTCEEKFGDLYNEVLTYIY